MTRIRRLAFLDASALIKRYSFEDGTDLVNELFRLLPKASIACSIVGIAEVVSVLVRKKNDGRLERRLFDLAMSAFADEFILSDSVLIAPINDSVVLRSLDLLTEHHVNSNDALILRSLLDLAEIARAYTEPRTEVFFVTSDKRLARAVGEERIPVLDPEIDTLNDLRRLLGLSEKREH